MNIKDSAISAVKWTSISTVIGQLMTLVISIFKFRILPADVFGTMAIVTALITILRMVQTLGLAPALVQKDSINDIFVYSIFWIIFGVTSFLAIILILCSTLISQFYNIEILSILIIIASLEFMITAITIVQSSLLTRDLKFKSVTLSGLVSTLFGGILTIFLALNDFKIWSIVYGSIFSRILILILYTKYTGWYPLFRFNLNSIRPSFNFGFNITIQKTIGTVRDKLPELIIGKVMGPDILGFYSFGKNIMLQILNGIDAMVSSVLFPLFSRLQSTKVSMLKGYIKANYYNFLLSLPISAGYLFLTDQFISVVYGEKWLAASTISQILIIATIFNSIFSKGASLIAGAGKPELLLKIEYFLFIPTAVVMFAISKFGLIYIGLVIVIERSIALMIQMRMLKIISELNIFQFIKSMKGPILASSFMIIMLIIFNTFLIYILSLKMLLFSLISLGGIVYLLFIFYLDKKEITPTIKLLIQAK